MKRAELDYIEPPTPTMGGAEVLPADDDHGPHVFLYVPDKSMETGWSTHRVPDRAETKAEPRTMGFHR